MTMDDRIRNDVLSKGAGCCALMFTVASTFSEQLVAVFGSYRTLICLYAVLAIVSFWGLFRTSEERYVKASVGEASAVLHLLAVAPSVQRRGVGKALLQFAAGCCRADGSRVLRLDTLPWNLPGKRLYMRALGFNIAATWRCTIPPQARSHSVCMNWCYNRQKGRLAPSLLHMSCSLRPDAAINSKEAVF